MKPFLKAAGILGVSFALVACGTGTTDESDQGSEGTDDATDTTEEQTEISISASAVPHAEILEYAAPLLEEQGITLDIIVAQDYVVPNVALAGGDVDANYFQHRPYLEGQMAENEGFDFAEAGAIHIEPMGLYSPEYDSVDDLPDGATVLMSNAVADHGRIFSLLHESGIITLENGPAVDASEADIAENERNLEFVNSGIEAQLLPSAYESNEADLIAINSNYAIGAGLSPLEDALIIEEGDQENPYVNLIVTRAGDENNGEIQTLVEVLQSDEIQEFILEEYDGAVVPVQ